MEPGRAREKVSVPDGQPLPLKQVVEEAEKSAIIKALKATDNNRSLAARLLGISRRALYDKISQYGLEM
jgi:two-component system, NtrC family, response regulator AtoC